MPKSYYDIMSEIKPNELYKGLLVYGLFSENLPPIFTSKPFYEKMKNCFKKNSKYKSNGYINYDTLNNDNNLHTISIPNPFSYNKLCYILQNNWNDLLKHFEKVTKDQSYKVSLAHIRKYHNTEQLYKMICMNEVFPKEYFLNIQNGAMYAVYTNISKCYHSIYSHVVSWALVGKNETKSEKNTNTWYNDIDECIMNTKHGEACGILIGPDASQLISEIILEKIDNEMYNKGYRYIRNIDDYTCYVESYEKVFKFIQDLNEKLNMYNLSLNQNKTVIEELPVSNSTKWIDEIKFINKTVGKCLTYSEVDTYLNKIIELFRDSNDNAAIFTYIIKSNIFLKSNKAVKHYVDRVLNIVILYPYLIHYVEEYVFEKCKVKKIK